MAWTFSRNHLSARVLADRSSGEAMGVDVLKSIEDRYRFAFDNANAGMFIVDLNGTILEANTRACDLLGLAPGSLNGCSVNDLALQDDHHVSTDAIQRLLSGVTNHETFEKRYRHNDGGIFHGLVSVSLVQTASGNPAYFISQMQDISNLKKIETALRLSEERMKFALAASGLGCWDWDVSTGGLFLNDRALEILGYQPEDLDLSDKFWELLSHPDDLKDTLKAFHAHMAGETASYEMEHRLRHKQGHWVWVLERGKVISRSSTGDPLRMTGTLEDVSARKRLEGESSNLLLQIERLMKEAVRPQKSSYAANSSPRKSDCLTKRQVEVLRLVASGRTSSQIAEQLHIATETVEGHRRDLMRKLDLHSVAALTRLALQEGLLAN